MQNTQQAIAQAVSVQLTRMNRTKSWLAGEIGMNLTSLSNRLNGRTPIDTEDISRFAEALGMTEFDLIAMANEERKANVA